MTAATKAKISASMRGNLNGAMYGKARRYDPRSESAYRQALARRIRDTRKALDISCAELAAAIGGHPATITKIERCQKNPLYTTIVRIAVALGVSPSELLP